MTTAVIVRDDAKLAISFTSEFEAQIEEALAAGALVGKVTNGREQIMAVETQKLLQAVLGTAEKARKEAKAPVIEYGRRIDDAVKAKVQETLEEMTRISRMVGSFEQLERKRIEAEKQAAREDLERIEKEKQQALAKANTEQQVDAIQEHFNNKAREVPTVFEQPRAQGQVVRDDWDVTVVNIWELARCHPMCVKIEPLVGEIKNLLKAGQKVAGVKAEPIVKSSVRGRAQKALDV